MPSVIAQPIDSSARPGARASSGFGAGAFTLIELLVVISIITVLISLLLPVLRGARQQGQAIVCMSNIRQVGVAVLTYTDTTNGRLPWNYMNTAAGDLAWNGLIHLITSDVLVAGKDAAGDYRSAGLLCPAEGITDINYNNIGDTPATFRNGLTAPVLVQFGPEFRMAGFDTPGQRVWTNYSLNGSHPGYVGIFGSSVDQLPDYDAAGTMNPQMDIGAVRKPSDSWIVFDHANCDIVPGDMVFRHPGLSANYGYLDGHAERLTTRQVDGSVVLSFYTGVGTDPRTDLIRN